jgi:hypothetical protein
MFADWRKKGGGAKFRMTHSNGDRISLDEGTLAGNLDGWAFNGLAFGAELTQHSQ